MPSLKDLMNEHERTIIERSLQEHKGNRSRTAEALGISRRGLLNKLKSHGLVATRNEHKTSQVNT